jgi:hypothetical protein
MAAAYNTIRQLDPYHLTVGAGFAGNKAQYTDAQINGNGQHKLDTLPMLPPITCDKAQGAAAPKPCESRFPAACDRSKNPTGGGCCISCGGLSSILPVTGLSLDIVMIENYSPSMDAHAKDDAGTLRRGVPWQTMVNCDGSCEYRNIATQFLSQAGNVHGHSNESAAWWVCRHARRGPHPTQSSPSPPNSPLDLDHRRRDTAPADLRWGGTTADGPAALGRGGLTPRANFLGEQR